MIRLRRPPERFNSAAEFVDGRSLVTPECLERLVANLAAAKFPEEDGDVALHLFFQRYVRAQPTAALGKDRLGFCLDFCLGLARGPAEQK